MAVLMAVSVGRLGAAETVPAPVADLGFVPLGKLKYEIVGVGLFGGADNLRLCSVG